MMACRVTVGSTALIHGKATLVTFGSTALIHGKATLAHDML